MTGPTPIRRRRKPPVSKTTLSRSANLTDTGNAHRLAANNVDRLLYCPTWEKWLYWDGSVWRRDVTLELDRRAQATVDSMYVEAAALTDRGDRDAALTWCKRSASRGQLRAMMDGAKSLCTAPPEKFDADPYLLCVQNGTLDLKTGRLRPHDPTDFITLMAPVEYRPRARDSDWEELLDRFVRPDEGKEEFLQRAVFASLTGATTDKAFINLFDNNDGNTGKTTFLESVLKMLGPYGATVNAESFLAGARSGGTGGHHRADLAVLAGVRMVASSETPPNSRLSTGLMKKLTAGSGMYQFHAKFEKPYEAPWIATIWIDGNEVAKANAEDSPLFERWRLTPFTHTLIGPKDPRWLERNAARPEYLAAVLAWAMRGRAEWLLTGMGTAPSVEAAVAEQRHDMDPLADFWDSACEFGTSTPDDVFWTTTDRLYGLYRAWLADHPGHGREIGQRNFVALLKQRPGVFAKKRRAGQPRKVTAGWDGVRSRFAGTGWTPKV